MPSKDYSLFLLLFDSLAKHVFKFNKFKKIDIVSRIFFDHNGLKLEIIYKKKIAKFTSV